VYAEQGGEVATQAAREFCRGIERLLGITPAVTFTRNMEDGESGVFLGTISRMESIFELSDMKATVAGKVGGFIITSTGKRLIIAGQDEPGLLYGIFRFFALLSFGEIHDGFAMSDAPVSPLRMINHWDNLDGTIERGYVGPSLFYRNGRFHFDPQRIEDYARLLASIGINRVSINNVNVRAEAKLLITEEYLSDAASLAAIFRRFGIRLFLSINFGAPWSLGKLPTADPLDPVVATWWKERTDIIYRHIPDLAGFIVKADSEGEPGPFQYNRTHADGANMLAAALKPHGG
jgi:alpha-glucuronidase